MRSSGYFTAVGLRIWGQFSTYHAGSDQAGKGRLIQHTLFVATQCRTRLRADIIELSDTVHTSFSAMLRD